MSLPGRRCPRSPPVPSRCPTVIADSGRELQLLGVRRHGSRVEIVIGDQGNTGRRLRALTRYRAEPDVMLTAESLCDLLRAEELPCVTLTTAADADEPAGTGGEGLRMVAGSSPVLVYYAIPPGNYAALSRRDSHLQWFADFADAHRWSVRWLADGSMTVHPQPWPATCVLDGAAVFRRTGRRVDENLGSHVVLWIVEDAAAWAGARRTGSRRPPRRTTRQANCSR
jgi:hypothetical protein